MFKKGFQLTWWYQLITYGVMMILVLLSAVISNGEENPLVTFISEFGLIIPCIVGYSMLKYVNPDINLRDDLGFRGIRIEYIFYILFMPIFYNIFCVYVTMPVTLGLNILFGSELPDVTMPENTLELIFTLSSLCILAPVIEEFIYRGVMIRLMKGYSFHVVMLTTSFAFAMMHMDLSGFVQIFFLGMLLYVIRIATGSVFASMAAHSMINLMSFTLMMIEEDFIKYESLLLTFEIGSVIVIPFIMMHFLRITDELEDWRETIYLKGRKAGISAGCIIFVVIYLVWNMGILVENIKSGYVQKSIDTYWGEIQEEETN